jgi:hypothetical protein
MITTCPHCQKKVLPKVWDICPDCQKNMFVIPKMNRPLPKASRPLGVWVLTLFNGLLGLQFLIAAWIVLTGEEFQDMSGKLKGLIVIVPLGLLLIIQSIRAWRGSNWGRVLMVIYAIIGYGILINRNFIELQTWNGSDEIFVQTMGELVRRLLSIGINVWYFLLSDRPQAFFRSSRSQPILLEQKRLR